MTGGPFRAPGLAATRALLEGARTLGGPHGAVLELCVTALCLPWEAVAIDLAEIDWREGRVPVPARGGTRRLLHLPPDALRLVADIAGPQAHGGQAVTGGRGRPLRRGDVRLDRLRARLAAAAPETAALEPWDFHGLRARAARELAARGSRVEDVALALGIKGPGSGGVPIGGVRTDREQAVRAATVVGRWNAILAMDPNAG